MCSRFYNLIPACKRSLSVLFAFISARLLLFCLFVLLLRADILAREATEEVPGTLNLSSPEGRTHGGV